MVELKKAEQERSYMVSLFKLEHQSSLDFELGLGLELNSISSPGSPSLLTVIDPGVSQPP